ncbi:MAG TPA: hypothetical protein VG265_13895 [Gaiellaceae bacterium]|nr:hypothetical protein [Gaiellaceae bacterium]
MKGVLKAVMFAAGPGSSGGSGNSSGSEGEEMVRIFAVSTATMAAALIMVAAGFTSAKDGRGLVASFNGACGPASGKAITLTEDGGTVVSLRPGEYWITMTDSCPTHNFTLADDPAATDGDELTGPLVDTPGTVTLKVQLKHGTYKLFCSNPSHPNMKVIFDVGGAGQTDA